MAAIVNKTNQDLLGVTRQPGESINDALKRCGKLGSPEASQNETTLDAIGKATGDFSAGKPNESSRSENTSETVIPSVRYGIVTDAEIQRIRNGEEVVISALTSDERKEVARTRRFHL